MTSPAKAIVLELVTGEFRTHEIDADPDVERWAIAFVDTDGAAWCYIASHLRSFVVTKWAEPGISVGEANDDEAARPDAQAVVDATSPTEPERAAGDSSPSEVDGDHPIPSTPPAAPMAEHNAAQKAAADAIHQQTADVCTAAIAASTPYARALNAAFGWTMSQSMTRIARARAAGFDIPMGKGGRRPADRAARVAPERVAPVVVADVERDELATVMASGTACDRRLVKVASIYRHAVIAGRRPIASIAEHLDIEHREAQDLVHRARAAGLLPPRNEPQVEISAPMPAAVPRARTGTTRGGI